MITNRTTMLGRLEEYKQRLNTLRIEIDTAAKGILFQFEPLDMDLKYIESIMPDRLQVNVNTITKKMKELKKIILEIKNLEQELGAIGG